MSADEAAAFETDKEGRRIASQKRYSGLRKVIGMRMRQSLDKAPQAMISTHMDMSGLARIKHAIADRGHKVTYGDLLIRVAGIALERNPQVNSSVQDGMLYVYDSVNIGMAVGTDAGLYVPVIRDANIKSLYEIHDEMKEIGNSLKAGKVDPTWFSGGTFTISNMGIFDIEFTTPIINAPEAAILCVGKTKQTPYVTETGEIAVRPEAAFSMTLDHSVMDGMPGARFMQTIGDVLKDPEGYLDEDGNERKGV